MGFERTFVLVEGLRWLTVPSFLDSSGYKGPKKHLAPPAVSTSELKAAIKNVAEGDMASPISADDAHGLGFGK